MSDKNHPFLFSCFLDPTFFLYYHLLSYFDEHSSEVPSEVNGSRILRFSTSEDVFILSSHYIASKLGTEF